MCLQNTSDNLGNRLINHFEWDFPSAFLLLYESTMRTLFNNSPPSRLNFNLNNFMSTIDEAMTCQLFPAQYWKLGRIDI